MWEDLVCVLFMIFGVLTNLDIYENTKVPVSCLWHALAEEGKLIPISKCELCI